MVGTQDDTNESFHAAETAVTAAEISRNFGEWQARAIVSPVTITHHGRARLVLSSVEAFERQTRSYTAPDISGRRARTQFRSMLSQLREGFIAYDSELRIADINGAAELFIGVSRDEALGQDLRHLRPETVDSIAWGHFRRVMRTGEVVDFRLPSAIHPGSIVHVRAFPYDDGVAVLLTNVTSEEEAQQLEAWRVSFRAAIALDASVALVWLDARGGLSGADAAFSRMTGISEPELLRLILTQLAPPHERLALARTINTVLQDRTARSFRMTCLTRNGQDRRLRLDMSPAPQAVVEEGLVALVTDLDAPREA